MKNLILYQIIGAGLFTLGFYGLLSHRNRWAVIIALQLMASSIILSLLTIFRTWHNQQSADELIIIFILGILAIEILLAIILTFKVFLSATVSSPNEDIS